MQKDSVSFPSTSSSSASLLSLQRADWTPVQTLMVYSLAMIVVPLTGFFTVKHFVNSFFDVDANLYAAIVAVLMIHCILFAFVVKAYNEDKQLAQKTVTKLD